MLGRGSPHVRQFFLAEANSTEAGNWRQPAGHSLPLGSKSFLGEGWVAHLCPHRPSLPLLSAIFPVLGLSEESLRKQVTRTNWSLLVLSSLTWEPFWGFCWPRWLSFLMGLSHGFQTLP